MAKTKEFLNRKGVAAFPSDTFDHAALMGASNGWEGVNTWAGISAFNYDVYFAGGQVQIFSQLNVSAMSLFDMGADFMSGINVSGPTVFNGVTSFENAAQFFGSALFSNGFTAYGVADVGDLNVSGFAMFYGGLDCSQQIYGHAIWAGQGGLVVESPNTTGWVIKVSNAGVISTEEYTG